MVCKKRRLVFSWLKGLIFSLYLLSAPLIYGADFFSTTSGDYANAATWVTDGCGGASAAGSAPGAGDNVTICDHTVTLSADSDANDVSINDGTLSTGSNWAFSISGNITIGDTIGVAESATFNGTSSQITVQGNFIRRSEDGRYLRSTASGGNTVYLTGDGTVENMGLSPPSRDNFFRLYAAYPGKTTTLSTFTVARGGVYLQGGVLHMQQGLSPRYSSNSDTNILTIGSTTLTGSGGFDIRFFDSGGTFEGGNFQMQDVMLQGSDGETFGLTGSMNNVGNISMRGVTGGDRCLFRSNGHTIDAQSMLIGVVRAAEPDFSNSTINVAGDFTISNVYTSLVTTSGTLNIGGNFVNDSVNANVFTGATLNVAGDFLNNGSLALANSTVNLSGTSSYSLKAGGDSLHHLNVNASGGSYNVQGSLTVNGDFSATAGTFASANALDFNGNISVAGATVIFSNTLNVSGNLNFSSGNLDVTAATAIFDANGGSTQTLTGNIILSSLVFADTGGGNRTIKVEAGSTQRFTTSFTANGSAAQTIILDTDTGSGQFTLNGNGSGTVGASYLDIKNNLLTNTATTLPLLPANSVDSGNTEGWFAMVGPTFSSVVANDPDDGDGTYSIGDTITITFDQNTNQPAATTKANVDALFSFNQALGADYSGSWANGSTLVITIDDASSATPPTVGGLQITLQAGNGLKNAAATSDDATGTSAAITGDWGITAPEVVSVVAADPDNQDNTLSNGDTITFIFDKDTNGPASILVGTKAQVDALFTGGLNLGLDYAGSWADASTLVITVIDAQGATNHAVGSATFTIEVTAGLRDITDTSPASAAVSPALSGSWGDKQASEALDMQPKVFSSDQHSTITFSGLGEGAQITILNIRGRKLAQLSADNAFIWQVVKANGALITSGVYFAHIVTNTESKTIKFAVVR